MGLVRVDALHIPILSLIVLLAYQIRILVVLVNNRKSVLMFSIVRMRASLARMNVLGELVQGRMKELQRWRGHVLETNLFIMSVIYLGGATVR